MFKNHITHRIGRAPHCSRAERPASWIDRITQACWILLTVGGLIAYVATR